MRKCAACGFEGDNFPGGACPQCGKQSSARAAINPWVGALVQFALAAGFMLIFHFPRPFIFIFAAFIFLGTLLSVRLRSLQTVRPKLPPAPQTPAAQFLAVAIGICAFLFFSCLLFGFAMFMNSWSAWQRYQGQGYHATTFQVVRVYYQRSRGTHGPSIYIYASGMVEGKKEWMGLSPYLTTKPHGQGELESMVPAGTIIPVYLFPDLKGEARVELIGPQPPAEANRKQAMLVLNRALTILAGLGLVIFVFLRIRRSIMENSEEESVRVSAAGA